MLCESFSAHLLHCFMHVSVFVCTGHSLLYLLLMTSLLILLFTPRLAILTVPIEDKDGAECADKLCVCVFGG